MRTLAQIWWRFRCVWIINFKTHLNFYVFFFENQLHVSLVHRVLFMIFLPQCNSCYALYVKWKWMKIDIKKLAFQLIVSNIDWLTQNESVSCKLRYVLCLVMCLEVRARLNETICLRCSKWVVCFVNSISHSVDYKTCNSFLFTVLFFLFICAIQTNTRDRSLHSILPA